MSQGIDDRYRARLIPTVGIKNNSQEQEDRATSVLLAVMHAVPDFSRALLKELGAPKVQPETFAQVRFADAAGKSLRPDGAIVCKRGSKVWTCLVEVKTGKAKLQRDQVEAYLDIARDEGFDGVLTISNEITDNPTESPVQVHGAKLRRTKLWHFSWWHVITAAILESRHRGIDDTDQDWILGELIAYFDSEASGIGGFEDMGARWVEVRTGVRDNTLRPSDAPVRDVAERWEQFTKYLCLGLSQDLGRSVTPVRPRRETAAERHAGLAESLASDGNLTAVVRVPDAVGDLRVEADLRARLTRTSVLIDAPSEGRARGKIGKLVRRLDDAPGDLVISVSYPNVRGTVSATLEQAREDTSCLLYDRDPRREPRRFEVVLSRAMGLKKGKKAGSFVGDTRSQVSDFYREIVQGFRPFERRAPRLPDPPDDEEKVAHPQADPPPFTGTSDREVGGAVEPTATA